MSKLNLRELTKHDEKVFLDGLKDWENEDLSWYTFVWKTGMNFFEHLEILEQQKNKINLQTGKVPSTMLYAFVENKIVGRLSVRHELNKGLLERGGHLGYAVSPLARNRGYATEIYKQGLEFCRKLGLEKILVTCSDQNTASWKIIEKFPAHLENRFHDTIKNEMVRRYWININEALTSSLQQTQKDDSSFEESLMKLQNSLILISDSKVKEIPIVDNGDDWIDLNEIPELNLDLEKHKIQSLSTNPFILRKQVVEKLILAQKQLPNSIKFQIKEGFRPLWVQNKFWKDYLRYLKHKFPLMNLLEVEEEAAKYIAPISVAPHSTGGAVDLVLIDNNGVELDMGTEFNASPLKTNDRTYTGNTEITKAAKANRKILKSAMQSVGFINYPTEWWHWSFGDQYWALMKNMPNALYQRKVPQFNIRIATVDDALARAQVHTVSWKSTYEGIIDQTYLDSLTVEQRIPGAKNRALNPTLHCFVAVEFETNRIVGFADFGPCREKNSDADCELYAIYILEEFQGFQAGRLLFEKGLDKMKDLNYKKMMISVLENNHSARSFYEKLGGHFDGTDFVDIQDIRYPTVTYIWVL